MWGRAAIGRTIARLLVGRNASARAIADFILMTLARNRAQQAIVAINLAIGAAFVIAALALHTRDFASLMQARPAVLWVPLVAGYWLTIGMRAAFFVPSELQAVWTFRANGVDMTASNWRPVRAAMIGFVVPRTLLMAVLLIPFVGWQIAARHAVVVIAVMVLFTELVASTVHDVPFTRPYRPGHAKLKTRWALYVVGLYLFAYLPTRVELWLGPSLSLRSFLAVMLITIIALEVAGHWRSSGRRLLARSDLIDDDSETTVLDLAGFAQSRN
jgi:hypothetical protein